MSIPSQYARIALVERPTTDINSSTFKVEKESIDALLPQRSGQVLVRIDYVSIDPAQRLWVSLDSYMPIIPIGDTMRANGMGTVVKVHESDENNDKVKVGDVVNWYCGWSEYQLVDVKDVVVVSSADTRPDEYIDSMADMVSKTAYYGLLNVGLVKPGETVVVSGAAGAVGILAVQIAKLKGAKVIGIAGGAEKCRWVESLGADKCIDYKQGSKAFSEAFDKDIGKLPLLFSSSRMEGFVYTTFASQDAEAEKDLRQWKREGKLKIPFHVEQGLENAPRYLQDIFKGTNKGKMIVKVSSKEPGAL
ncbi:hypothetical protein FRB96_001498 [Tulasnella sp. 330]|nr:hypothetical protein FRB96_001498 [Tulasnella sp. 330]KAG8886631.1 hypothetical protein FRB97_000051 [Tulasnella sp. 331]KAG8890676.1 hypothetical protein FRB98_006179 [Tulasnella sp. 332]